MAKKTAPEEKKLGALGFTDEQVVHIKAKLPELIPRGWTIRQELR